MDLVYRAIGFVSRMCERGSRYRVNAIGTNWWMLVGVIVFLCLAVGQIVESLHNSDKAAPIPLRAVLAGEGMVDRYIAVEGKFDLEGSLTQESKSNKEPEEMWIPLVDDQDRRAVYAQVTFSQMKRDKPDENGRVLGMLRKMDSDLHAHVAKNSPKVDGITIDDRFVLVVGDQPARMWVWVAVAAALFVFGAMIVLSIGLRYVIFRREGHAMPKMPRPPSAEKPALPAMRASGVFVFNGTDRRRFLDVNAVLAEMESNDPAIVTQIDASERFMGRVTRSLNGIWAMVMKAGSIQPPQNGYLYAGTKRRPALRIYFTDAVSGGSGRAILSFDSEADRENGLANLADYFT